MSDKKVPHLDFLIVSTKSVKKGVVQIYPRFKIGKSADLMIRGSDFYAVWLEEKGIWSTDEEDLIRAIDNELYTFYLDFKDKVQDHIEVLYMWDADSGAIDRWHKYCQKQCRDNYKTLNELVLFSNDPIEKKQYASKRLDYALEPGNYNAWKELTSTLYSPDELKKIEWSIGAIITGDSKEIQKCIVFYGPPGTGKSTILEIIQTMFKGYYAAFDSKSLGLSSASFSLEPFKENPLIAIQHDGDLSKIEDNTRLNSLIAHEEMIVNEKHKSLYTMRFNSFTYLGTNKPVMITDAKSGMVRRVIDVYPTGNKIPKKKYSELMAQIRFELGHIAYHCKEVYLANKNIYDEYRPIRMMSETNDMFNFVEEYYTIFSKDDGVTLKQAWDNYKLYCEEAKIKYPLSRTAFQAELGNYFNEFNERSIVNGVQVRSYFSGFRTRMFEQQLGVSQVVDNSVNDDWLSMKEQKSILDEYCKDCFAQEASDKETPKFKWDNVTTTLKDIDTSKTHYLKVPQSLICIDFDMKDENGEKSFELNKQKACNFPKTYAEVSKSGGGIHLHYIYNGDVTQLSRLYADNIEIKIFTGNSSLRRRLSICNSEPITTISSGLPKKEVGKVINKEAVKDEKMLRAVVMKALRKEVHPATKPSMDFIYKIIDEAYTSGLKYDISDLSQWILTFAAGSTHQSDYCLDIFSKLKFKSDEPSEYCDDVEAPIVFYDVETFPNLFLVNYKFINKDKVFRLINPTPAEIEQLFNYRLVGFNCRNYDNHMIYACHLGYTNSQLYDLSQSIIVKGEGKFGEAYNISYTDIYDYASTKQSLKKWEIQLGIHHLELGYKWNEPVPEDKWYKVAEYCDNDVVSTETVWFATQDDFVAREILADIAGMSVNDTTNTLTTRIIFGFERHPQLVYTNLEEEFPGYKFEKIWNEKTRKYEYHNWYRGVDLGLGGYVSAEPGMYGNVALLDVASLHPHSAIALNIFGSYTKNFKDLVDTRIHIKHKSFDKAMNLFDGKLKAYLSDVSNAKKLSKALKIAINSVYGLTSAKFDNPFRDPRNQNNIVALRGALFMKTLQDEVLARGFQVAHIKTDSIKIPDATPEIIDFCMEFAKKYKYTFEHEATYEKICLVNDAVYIAKYKKLEDCKKLYGEEYVDSSPDVLSSNKEHPNGDWTATGTQFAVPYVFKTCFSHEPIVLRDMCETKEVKSAMYLDFNEGLSDVMVYEKLMVLRKKLNTEAKITKSENKLLSEFENISDDDINRKISEGHNYHFVGKVGLFCPIVDGAGGGILLREQNLKDGTTALYSATGADGFRWIESEQVVDKGLEDKIDRRYYHKLVNNAIESISKFGDYEWFASDEPYISPLNINPLNGYDNVIKVTDDMLPF